MPAGLRPAQGVPHSPALEDSGCGAYPSARALCWLTEGRAASAFALQTPVGLGQAWQGTAIH